MALRLDQNINEGSIVKVSMVEVRRNAALEQSASLLDLFSKLFEQGVPLDATNDFLFVVERQIARDGAREAASGFFGLNQCHPAETPFDAVSLFLTFAVKRVIGPDAALSRTRSGPGPRFG